MNLVGNIVSAPAKPKEVVYNPLQHPPNLELARMHGEAKRIKALLDPKDTDLDELCPCCGLSTVAIPNTEN